LTGSSKKPLLTSDKGLKVDGRYAIKK
jgi:hypothetical protein